MRLHFQKKRTEIKSCTLIIRSDITQPCSFKENMTGKSNKHHVSPNAVF